MDKILFVDVIKRDASNTIFEHLGIMYLQAALQRSGYESEMISTRFDSERTLYQKVKTGTYGMVALSVMQIDAPRAIHIAQELRRRGFKGYILLGGHWATFHPEEILRNHPEVDFVLTGESDFAIVQLVEALSMGSTTRLDQVSGLGYRSDKGYRLNPHTAVPNDLNLLPFPLRNQYSDLLRQQGHALSVSGSRGCFAHCTFCDIVTFHRKIRVKPYRSRTNENICDEIEQLGVDKIEFVDDQFIDFGEAGKERAYAFADEIERRKLKITFAVLARVDTIDRDVMKRLHQVGLRHCLLGIEAISRDDLKVLGKHITPEASREAIKILDEVGVEGIISMLIVNPYSTFETVRENLEFLAEVRPYLKENKHTVSINTMKIFSGTPIHTRLAHEKRLTGNYLGFNYKRNNGYAVLVELYVDLWLNGLRLTWGHFVEWAKKGIHALKPINAMGGPPATAGQFPNTH
ncbi:MAG: cobalamin B12-binding domain-containing protein [Acidobacteria bacterium]|nr:cobalamin B12-binding domain-containing protein [Acidobacteriota bacterium]MBI3654788.1 cobalamin B12-binding domain-containing protein [Acidobacteriota bacterium]